MGFGEASFLSSLVGKTTTFLMDGRRENGRFATLLARSLAEAGMSCKVLDLDAFYSSNADRLFGDLKDKAGALSLRVPPPGADIEAEFAALFGAQEEVVAVDSLNTLYHLVSMDDGRAKGRKIMFAFAGLSQFARSNAKAVIMSEYRREGFGRRGKGRSIASLSDITASVSLKGEGLELRTERGAAWKGGAFFSPVP